MNFKNPILWLTFLLKSEEHSIDGKSEFNIIQKKSIVNKPYLYRLLDKENQDITETIIKKSNPKYDAGILRELTNSDSFFTKAKEYFTNYFNLMVLGLGVISTNTLQYFLNKKYQTNKDASTQYNTRLGANQNIISPMTKEEILSGKKLPKSLVDNNENIPTSMAKNTKNPALPSLKMNNNSSIRSNTPRGTCQNIVSLTKKRYSKINII